MGPPPPPSINFAAQKQQSSPVSAPFAWGAPPGSLKLISTQNAIAPQPSARPAGPLAAAALVQTNHHGLIPARPTTYVRIYTHTPREPNSVPLITYQCPRCCSQIARCRSTDCKETRRRPSCKSWILLLANGSRVPANVHTDVVHIIFLRKREEREKRASERERERENERGMARTASNTTRR